MVDIRWTATWTYRAPIDEQVDINGSFWFQLSVFFSAIVLWTIVIIRSTQQDTTITVATRNPVKSQFIGNWLNEPRIIVTRTTVSLLVALGTAELLIFNAVANYAGDGSINASSALFILMAALMFHFFTMSHKFVQSTESHERNRMYGLPSFIVLLMIVGVFVCYLGYTDAFSSKTASGATSSFIIGAVLFVLGTLLMCTTPLLDTLKPYSYKRTEDDKLQRRLIFSGEFYTALTIIDCLVIWSSSATFILLEALFIGDVFTANYALPFLFLQIIPIYGFIISVISSLKTKVGSYVPIVYNMGFFVIMSLCFATSMLHVCAIPGVSTMCVTSIPHTTFYTNVFVCGPYVLFLFATSIGLVYSSCKPTFLAKHLNIV